MPPKPARAPPPSDLQVCSVPPPFFLGRRGRDVHGCVGKPGLARRGYEVAISTHPSGGTRLRTTMPGGGGPAGAGAGGGGGRGKAKKGGALRRAASHAQLSADLKASIASWLRKRGKAVRPELTKEEREEIKVRVGAAAPPSHPPPPPLPGPFPPALAPFPRPPGLGHSGISASSMAWRRGGSSGGRRGGAGPEGGKAPPRARRCRRRPPCTRGWTPWLRWPPPPTPSGGWRG